jgi:hypothetical protein
MKSKQTIKRGAVRTTAMGLAVLATIGLALLPSVATAEKDAPFTAKYLLTVDEFYGSHIVASGPGTGTVVGISSMVAHVHLKGTKSVGSATITAANGDLIYLVSTQTEEPGTPAVGPFTIVGGTGRFANASGSGTTVARDNPDGTVTSTLDGTISF